VKEFANPQTTDGADPMPSQYDLPALEYPVPGSFEFRFTVLSSFIAGEVHSFPVVRSFGCGTAVSLRFVRAGRPHHNEKTPPPHSRRVGIPHTDWLAFVLLRTDVQES
jgi:hypothetical protein